MGFQNGHPSRSIHSLLPSHIPAVQSKSTIARICHQWRVPIIPYSGGSSLEGHTAAPFGGVSMDFVYMDQIVKINEDDMDVVVQPSVQWVDLNERLKQMGTALFFPMDPGSSPSIFF